MNIKKIITIAFSFLFALPVSAAMSYPTIAGITISESTSSAEYVIYFFNLSVSVGTFIAAIMVVIAGFEWLTSSGNPSKVELAKSRITNALIGVVVLLGCYIFLNAINPQLTNIKISEISCENGVVLSVKQANDQKIKQKCIDSNQININDTILSTLRWNFPQDYLLKVYAYPEANYQGTPKEYDCTSGYCSGDIPNTTKSIYFLLNNPGIYLYDGNSYTPDTKGSPIFTITNIPDLSKVNNFDNFTKSIDIINPDSTKQNIQYQAVIFKDQNYRGRCAFVAQSVPDMNQSPNGYYTDRVGDNEVSSIIIAKANLDPKTINEKRGEVILYNATNCPKSNTETLGQVKACHIPIGSISEGHIDILKYCNGGAGKGQKFELGDDVMSFEITGAAGLVLSTSEALKGNNNTYCQYFNKLSLGDTTCLSSIRNTSIFTVGGKTPRSFIVLPDN